MIEIRGSIRMDFHGSVLISAIIGVLRCTCDERKQATVVEIVVVLLWWWVVVEKVGTNVVTVAGAV